MLRLPQQGAVQRSQHSCVKLSVSMDEKGRGGGERRMLVSLKADDGGLL